MKNLSLFSLMLMAGLLLFLGGCAKDVDSSSSEHLDASFDQNLPALLPLDSFPDLARFLQKKFRQVEGRNNIFNEDDIDKSCVFVVEYDNNLTTYSMVLKSDTSDNIVYNVVIEKKESEFTNIKVVVVEYYTRNHFTHTQYAFSDFFGGGNRNSELIECIKQYYFVNEYPPVTPSQGGGMDEFGPPNGPPNPPKPSWPNIGTGGTVITSGSVSGTMWTYSITSGCTNCEGTLITFPCNNGTCCICIRLNTFALNGEQNGTRDLSEECKTLLQVYGFMNEDFTIRTEEVIRECRTANPAVKEYLNEIKEQNYINVCTGKPAIDVDNLELKMCFLDKYNLEDVKKEVDEVLEQNPHIKITTNLATDCPKLNCILNKLINGEGPSSDFLCDLMSKFDGSPGFTIGSAVPKTNEPDFSGKTVPSPTGKSIAIVFNKDKCKTTNGINLFETLQHELVHADFYRQLIKDYNWNGSDMTLDATFRALVVAKYGPNATPDQHVLMLNQILPDMINSLMQANGSTIQCTGFEESGDCKHFKTLIINGFGEELLETELGISFQQHTINANEYNLWKLTQPIFINLNTCP